jgi:hypothetical protein
LKRVIAGLLAVATFPVHAGRPLTTDDVAVVDDKACQLESWIERSRDVTRAWAAPSCNFGAGIEWQAGFAREHADSRSYFSESYVQAKRVFIDPQKSGWGVGLTAGLARTVTRATHRGWEDPYATFAVTLAPGEKSLVHLNVGWARDRAEQRDSTPWGIAGERALSDRVSIVAEAFGVNRESPFLRVGVVLNATKGLDFDVSVVTKKGGTSADRQIALGFTWLSVPFLP